MQHYYYTNLVYVHNSACIAIYTIIAVAIDG